MGGSSIDDDWEFASPSNGVSTVVLVGRTGNGKSATGNSILGRKAFKSRASSSGVTSICELQRTVLKDGQILNVIDTPGLFDFSVGSEFVGKEIVKCIDLAKDGIHAVLVVLSVRTRFSQEEEASLHSLQTLIGSKIVDYMVVVFTGGDELEDNDETLEDYLGRECPDPLKEILTLCENRLVLFDNKTKNEAKRADQVQQLLSLVNMVIAQNGGMPYTDELFVELKKGAVKFRDQQVEVDSLKGYYSKREISELKEQMQRSYEEQLERITEMVELNLRETSTRLEQQLAEEKAVRLKAAEIEQLAQMISNDEIRRLRKNLEKARRETEGLCKRAENRSAIPWLRENLEKAQRETEELCKRAESQCAPWLRENLKKAQRETEELRKRVESQSAMLWLRENLGKAQTETEELRKRAESQCAIL